MPGAAKTLARPRRAAVGRVRVRDDAEDLRRGDVGVDVGREQHDVLHAEAIRDRAATDVRLEAHLAQRGRQHVGSAAVGEQVDALDAWTLREQPDRLLQVLNGELARLAIDVVSGHHSAITARGPAEDRAGHLAAEEVAQVGHREDRILERIGVAVDEECDVPARRRRDAPRDLGLQGFLRLLVRVDHRGHASDSILDDLHRVRDRREAAFLRRAADLEFERHAPFGLGARLDETRPRDVLADLDDDGSERHRTRTIGPVAELPVRTALRSAIRDVEEVERRRLADFRREERLRERSEVEIGRRHQDRRARAAREQEAGGRDPAPRHDSSCSPHETHRYTPS